MRVSLSLFSFSLTACFEKPVEEEVVNTAPSAPEISLSPEDPTTVDDLQVYILSDGVDPEGDTVSYRYVWLQGGAPAENDSDLLSSDLTAKGETWSVTVYATDGELESDGVEKSVTVVNSTPVITVSIDPTSPSTEDDLTVTMESSDPDGDELTLSYAWLKEGTDIGFSDETVAANATLRGEVWSVQVTGNDGELDSTVAEASVTIENSLPVVSDVLIAPELVFTGDSITVTSTTSDADGDAVILSYAWMVDGALMQSGVESVLSSDSFAKGQSVSVNVIPNDGVADGQSVASNSLTVLNTPPVFTSISLDPAAAYTDTALTCLPTGWYDADGDTEAYNYEWTVDGAVVGSNDILDSTFFIKDSLVQCTATANDGEEDGTQMSVSATVQNSVPVTTVPALAPTSVYATDDLICTAGTTSDADGDTVTDNYSWTVNLTTVSAATGQVLPGGAGYFIGGDDVQCHVTPNEGSMDGFMASSNIVAVTNSLPIVSLVEIVTQRGDQAVYTDDSLSVTIAASDADGDSLSYTYQWMSGGVTLSTNASLDGSFFNYGDQLSVTVTANDGTVDGSPVTSSSLTVSNTPPTQPSVVISPSVATAGVDDLTCSLSTASADADGDTVQYSYVWRDSNGATLQSNGPTTSTTDTLSSALTSGGNCSCEVIPTDGMDSGSAASSSLSLNTAPVVSQVTIVTQRGDQAPYSNDVLSVNITSTDADGDSISYSYQWMSGGILLSTNASLDGGYFSAGNAVSVMVTPHDGLASGLPMTSTSLTVLNSAPSQPSVAISPSAATVGVDNLTCTVSSASMDVDGDAVYYTFVWSNSSGANVQSIGPTTTMSDTLSSTLTTGGNWTCQVTPSDGVASGSSGSATVNLNTAPIVNQAYIVTQRGDQTVYTDDTLSVNITASDVNGDSISYSYQWMSNSGTLYTGASLSGVYFSAGNQISVTIIPSDGSASGSPYTTQTLVVVNSAPTAPVIEITPQVATAAEDDLLCSVITAGNDVDGDQVLYTYVWTDPAGVQIQSTGPTYALADVLSSSLTYEGTWTCIATATDGTDTSGQATATGAVDFCGSQQVSLVPVLSSNNGPNGLTVSASSINTCGSANCNVYQPWKAFNGTAATHEHDTWFSGGTSSTRHFPQWLMVDLGSSSTAFLQLAEIYTTNSGYSDGPTSYQLQASNDTLNWDVLVDVSNDNTIGGSSLSVSHAVSSGSYYRYIRLYVTASTSNQSEVKISEMVLYGCYE